MTDAEARKDPVDEYSTDDLRKDVLSLIEFARQQQDQSGWTELVHFDEALMDELDEYDKKLFLVYKQFGELESDPNILLREKDFYRLKEEYHSAMGMVRAKGEKLTLSSNRLQAFVGNKVIDFVYRIADKTGWSPSL